MGALILQEYISVDGFCADRKKTTGFFDGTYHSLPRDVDAYQGQFCASIDLILLGTNTYKMFSEYWPNASSDDSAVTGAMNTIPKIVFSKSLREVHWGRHGNISLVADDAVTHIRSLKSRGDKNIILWGSLALAKSLLEAQLVDEVHLVIVPVAIGKGFSLFPEDIDLLPLRPVAQRSFSDGTCLQIYHPEMR